MTKSNYSAKNIKSFDRDTDKVRAKPTMYIGPLGSDSVLHLMREVFDNSVDEHIAGRNNHIYIVHDQTPKGDTITVIDCGNGIPTEPRKVHGKTMSTLETVFTQLQAGAKMDDKAYKSSRGTHGVGVTATNALSDRLQVWSTYKGKCVTLLFKKGITQGSLKSAKRPKFGKFPLKQGTAVQFQPDLSILGAKARLSPKRVVALCDQTAYMNPKLTIVYQLGKKIRKFAHRGGLGDFIKHRVETLGCKTLGKVCVVNEKAFNVAFQFTDGEGDQFEGYTNSLPNKDGGVHVELFRNTLFKVLKKFATSRDKAFTPNDLREGMVGLIDFKLSSPEFSSQTKEKLVDHRVKDQASTLEKVLSAWFSKHKSLAKEIIRRAGELKSLKEDQLKDRRALRALKTTRNDSKLPPANKLTTAKCKPADRELFIVEGDSAGGTAKFARLPHQEVLKLRGKILNTLKDKQNKTFESQEVLNILLSLGYDPSKKDPYENLRVGKVVLMSDPDPDGYHINSLTLGLLVKYMRPLFDRGMVYVANIKEFYALHKGKLVFGSTAESVVKRTGPNVTVNHIKGFGEVSPELLRMLAFDPATRRLVKLKPLTSDDVKRFTKLMGDDVDYRKKLLKIKV